MGNIYIGNSGIAKKANKIYIGDSNGIARQVKKIYIGDSNGIAREVYSSFTPVTGTIVEAQLTLNATKEYIPSYGTSNRDWGEMYAYVSSESNRLEYATARFTFNKSYLQQAVSAGFSYVNIRIYYRYESESSPSYSVNITGGIDDPSYTRINTSTYYTDYNGVTSKVPLSHLINSYGYDNAWMRIGQDDDRPVWPRRVVVRVSIESWQ